MADIPAERVEQLIAQALKGQGVNGDSAQSVARALVNAEIDGQGGHGISRFAAYSAQVTTGKVNAAATPQASNLAPGFISIDAQSGFAFPAVDAAIKQLTEQAGQQGIALAAIKNSHHAGQLGAHVERLAKQGLVAIMVSNTPKAMPPWGASEPIFGTNPIAFAAPREGDEPLVIDLSLSKVARGKIMRAAQKGESIPQGWAMDKSGQPTSDANDALAGSMLPVGDTKGAALALIVEVLSATLTGANYSFEASSFFEAEGPAPGIGHLIIAINPGLDNQYSFTQRLEVLLNAISSQPGTRIPGSSRLTRRAANPSKHLNISEEVVHQLEQKISTD